MLRAKSTSWDAEIFFYIGLLILLLTVTNAAAEADPGGEQSPYACDQLDKVPPAQRCTFVTKQCISDGGLPYTQWYYCNVAPRGIAASLFFTLLLAALLPLLFTLLGDTAELYFSPIMTHVSQSIPKMRPRFAGVTFVAMGNGATDLSSNITAIRNGDLLLSAGALTGAAMFVQCIVASEVMRASRGPVRCRGATLRDVGIYIASVLLVLTSFAYGRITHWFIVLAVLLYLTYAVWVFLGDEWHEKGRPEMRALWRSFRSSVDIRWPTQVRVTNRRRPERSSLPWAVVHLGAGPSGGRDLDELTTPLVCIEGDWDQGGKRLGGRDWGGEAGPGGNGIISRPASPTTSPPPIRLNGRQLNHHLMSAKAYQEMVWADLSNELPYGDGTSTLAASHRGRQHQRRRESRNGGGDGDVQTAAAGRSGRPGFGMALSQKGLMSSSAAVAAAEGIGGASQLVTLSSLNGSMLAAPAPVDAVPLRAVGTTDMTVGGGGAASAIPVSSLDLQVSPSVMLLSSLREGRGASVSGKLDCGSESSGLGDSSAGSAHDDDDDDEEGGRGGGLDEYESLVGSGQRQKRRHRRRGRRCLEEDEGGGGDSIDDVEVAVGGSNGLRRGLWGRLMYELTVGTSAEWEQLPPDSLRRRWRAVTFPLLLPVYLALRLTIPFVDPATYSRLWLVATCAGAPLLATVYLAPGSWVAAIAALAAGGALAAVVAYFTAGEDDALPEWDLGTGFAFGPAFFSVFGFFVGIIWIDILASQVVGVIVLLAGLLKLPASLMGLTLLAWGNSLGDFFGNPAMARRGKPTMALTACFAGPLFNMLTSMALGFGSYFARRQVDYAAVQLRPEVALGCGCLILYNVAVAVAGLLNRGSLPERFYLFARGWYVTYLAAACVLGLWAGQA